MHREQIDNFYALTRTLRRLFHVLGNGVGALHDEADVSTGMRAVLETLTESGPMTVPDMARMRPVTRQHIQSLVNPLLELGYVETVPNPAHKRSPLIRATPAGEQKFRAMRQLETTAFRKLQIDVSAAQFESTNQVLTAIVDALTSDRWQDIVERSRDRSPKS